MSKNERFDYEGKLWGTAEVGLQPKYLGATRLKYCLEALKQLHKGAVLDLGCGGGAFTRAIKRARPELEVLGCDISEQALNQAKQKGGQVKYKIGDIYKLPFKTNSLDAVVSFDVFEHLENPGLALQEAHRILKNDGLLHFFIPCEGNKMTLYQLLPRWIYDRKRAYTGHIAEFTDFSLVDLFTKSKFKIIKSRYSLYFIYQLVELIYFCALRIRGRNVKISVEGYLQKHNESIFDKFLHVFTKIFGYLSYAENEIFFRFPGGGIHITAKKI